MAKERLDKVLTDQGLCDSRSQAQGLILAGKVLVNEQKTDKPGTLIDPEKAKIRLLDSLPYVSRGGLKLEKALASFQISAQDRVCIDIGASTGGFTDCLLQRGAAKVYAVDVGYGQLDWKLRQDPRVVCLEKTNARSLTTALVPDPPSLAVTDVSFISLKKVLPVLPGLMDRVTLTQPAEILALLKPQFEYKDYVEDASFKGVVRGESIHCQIIRGVLKDLAILLPGFVLNSLSFSPVTGPKGNIEYLLHYVYQADDQGSTLEPFGTERVEQVVSESYKVLLGKSLPG